jgi:hypothetical protein
VHDDAAPPEPAQQGFWAWEDLLGKLFRGVPNYIGVDADSVVAEPQQHARWILWCLLSLGFIAPFCAMYFPIFLAVSYIDSFQPTPIIVLVVLLVAALATVLCVAVSSLFCLFCSAGICEYYVPGGYRLTDNLLQI